MRALTVDDYRVNLMLFEQACACADVDDVRLSSADSEAEALELARQNRPDLMVIDLHRSDTISHDLLPRLRTLPGLRQVPTFLCTADDCDSRAGSFRFAPCDMTPA